MPTYGYLEYITANIQGVYNEVRVLGGGRCVRRDGSDPKYASIRPRIELQIELYIIISLYIILYISSKPKSKIF
jgi:hypothetical protein